MQTKSGTYDNHRIVESLLPSGIAADVPDKLCEKLARTHYENFSVGSILLPKSLRRHMHNIYAYCRICDDLADEVDNPELSLRLLEWWRQELYDCYRGMPKHPVFKALADTINEFHLPIKPFDDLISAFMQDQRVTRYATFEELKDYCSRSANPVGRLVLALFGYTDSARQQLSDYTCTALQLTNFWQDIAVDYRKGRIYIPKEDMERFGYTEYELRNSIVNASFVRLMRFETERARDLFRRGAELSKMVSGPGAAEVALFTAGGMAVLNSLQRSGYNVFRKHVSVSKSKKIALIAYWGVRKLIHSTNKKGS